MANTTTAPHQEYIDMIDMKKTKKSIAEVERAVNDISRPMRWETAEGIAKRFVKSNLDMWIKLQKDLFSTIKAISAGESLTYETLLGHERNKGYGFPYDIKVVPKSKKESHLHFVQKKADPTQGDISGLIIRLQEFLRPDQISAIENLFNTYSSRFFNSQNPSDRTGIWGTHIPNVFQDGYDEAFTRIKKAARQFGNLNEVLAFANFTFDPESLFIKAYYETTFKLVTSKVSFAAKGEVLGAMANGFDNGQTWKEISEEIYRVVGAGYRYHWQRLVRTEMTQMYYQAFVDRYTHAGAKFVWLSTSVGACPICVGIRDFYTLGSEPKLTESTHPNCRCVYTPFFRLPEGATVRM